jgi:tol-pal system protein YbgF
MDENMIELRARNAGQSRKIDELQNRVFILEDKLDTRRAPGEARRARPVATSKHIGDPTREEVTVTIAPSVQGSDATVEYAGEAAKRNRARPVLRLSGTGSAHIAFSSPPPEASPAALSGSSKPLVLYRESLDALKAGRIAAALAGFRKFQTRYPRHNYADNVQYWIGECYFNLDQFQAAVRELRRVVVRYPHGNKVPDAMLKIGLAHLARGERRDGRQALEALCRTYPKHAATRLATERLAQDDRRAPATVSLDLSRRAVTAR